MLHNFLITNFKLVDLVLDTQDTINSQAKHKIEYKGKNGILSNLKTTLYAKEKDD
ncbi:hypothetical protein [Sulfurimonas sp. RIFOXYB12_FULL_35_9]|uniref:hypothetical protein n=1 Tax=Sulfurimonas sp. RIFOXYB12_FULL_35_9 TaxID=1802256 RepID=UPI0025D04A3F|nr:hypothetical protein [Sulfurimonas sp. RIFOXYB12_FULL_35_9]